MKRLMIKVFLVIFILFSTFTLILCTASVVRGYLERKKSINEILTRLPKSFDMKTINNGEFNDELNNKGPNEFDRKIFLDSTIYTVVLDENGKYEGVINHTSNEDINEKEIKKIAENIIKTHKEKLYIGNLYTSRYSYYFTIDNTLIIMDNYEVNTILINEFMNNLIMLSICELIIAMISNLLTVWITTPIKNSFEKQKTFVADASHELKTPLSVIVASCDAYENDHNDKWVNNIRNESERMIKLVRELLDLAKTEQEQDLVLSKNNLSNIVESSILTFESLFYDNKIKLKYDIKPDIYLHCNEDSIIELMSILIDNAIKHSDKNGKVLVNLYRKNWQIILDVKNTGDPIKKGEEEKIFERFYKSDASRNRNSDNYGLGLAIAKNIVTKHHGMISAFSTKDYTTFRVVWNQK